MSDALQLLLAAFPDSELADEEQALRAVTEQAYPQEAQAWHNWNCSRPPLDLSKVRTVEKEKRLARKRARKAA
jgi:hypothetical protein